MKAGQPHITLGERCASAAVAAVAAAGTLLLYFGFALYHRTWDLAMLLASVFSRLGLSLMGLAAVAGFCLGSTRLADLFSFFWGTHPVWQEEWMGKIAVVVIVIAFLYFEWR